MYADLGAGQNIKKDMKSIVFREGEKIVNPVTGFDLSKIRVKDFIITK